MRRSHGAAAMTARPAATAIAPLTPKQAGWVLEKAAGASLVVADMRQVPPSCPLVGRAIQVMVAVGTEAGVPADMPGPPWVTVSAKQRTRMACMPRNESRSQASRPEKVSRPVGWPKKAWSSSGCGGRLSGVASVPIQDTRYCFRVSRYISVLIG
ncbi:hypothetical protein SNL152K_4158 [Streptomyces sp. NL15-2K]|nr:hypothetical protein SNL152K_4158 [Streptomyces sp. NL15-2K]